MNAAAIYRWMGRGALVVLIFLMLSTNGFSRGSDEWRGRSGNVILQNWSLGVTLGFTSYYGDLSQYDANYFQKLIFESKPAMGVELAKYFHPVFGVSGQVIYGGFRSDFLPDHVFSLKLLEYNAQVIVDPTSLLFRGRDLQGGLEAYAGMGQFLFQTQVGVNSGEQLATASIMDGTPEFVYFFGGTFYYKVSSQLRATVDLSIRQAQNDNIDKYICVLYVKTSPLIPYCQKQCKSIPVHTVGSPLWYTKVGRSN